MSKTDTYAAEVAIVGMRNDADVASHQRYFDDDWGYSWTTLWGSIEFGSSSAGLIDFSEVHCLRFVGKVRNSGQYTLSGASGELGSVSVAPPDLGADVARKVAEVVRSRSRGLWVRHHQFGGHRQGIVVTREPLRVSGSDIPNLSVHRDDLTWTPCLGLIEMAALRLALDQPGAEMVQFFVLPVSSFDEASARAYPDDGVKWGLANCAFIPQSLATSPGLASHEMGHILLDCIGEAKDRTLMNSNSNSRVLSEHQFRRAISRSGPGSKGPQLLKVLSPMAAPPRRPEPAAEPLWPRPDEVQLRLARAAQVLEGERAVGEAELRSWARSDCPALRFTAMRALAAVGAVDYFLESEFDVRLGLLAVAGLEEPWVALVFRRFEGERDLGRRGVEDGFQARRRVVSLRRRWEEARETPSDDLVDEIIGELELGYDDHRDGLAFWDPVRGGAPAVVWAERRWRELLAPLRKSIIESLEDRPERFKDFLDRPRLAMILESLV